MAKTIPFNIRLKIDGKDVVVTCRRDVEKLGDALGNAKNKSREFGESVRSLASVTMSFRNAFDAIQNLTSAMSPYIEKANAAAIAQTKLTTVMRERMAATTSDVNAINAAVSAQTKLGVVGGTVQRSGLQQLATFARYKTTLTTLLPAMNNLLTQQKGLNATSEDAVTVANLIGKALTGQTSALRRVGITFSDAQANAIKAGKEGERAAMIAEIITQNVGNMNAELAKTDAGRVKQLSNSFGSLMVRIGTALSPYQAALAQLGQLGMAVTGAVQLGTALLGCGRAAVTAAVSIAKIPVVASLVSQASVGLRAVMATLTAALTGTAVGATTAAVAMRTLLIASGVGIAIAALSAIVVGLGSQFREAAKAEDAHSVAMETSKTSAAELKQKLQDLNSQVEQNRGQLYQDIAMTKNWHGTKAQEKKIVEQLNSRYGETMGYFSSVAEWYQALIKNSEAYCRQLVIEAQMRAYANQMAANDMKIRELRYDDKGNLRRYSTRRKTQADQMGMNVGLAISDKVTPVGVDFYKPIKGTSELDKVNAQLSVLYRERRRYQNRLNMLTKEAASIKMPEMGSITPPSLGGGTGKGGKGGKGGKTPKVKTGTGARTGTGRNTPSAVDTQKPDITDGISNIEQLDVALQVLYTTLANLPQGKIQEALEISENISELESYRKKLEDIETQRGALTLKGAMEGIAGNTPGNTQQANLAGMFLPSADDLHKQMRGLARVTDTSIIASIDIRNNQAEELRRQIETVINAVQAGDIGENMGQQLVEGLNNQLQSIGKKGRPFKQLMKDSDATAEKLNYATDAVSKMGSSLSSMGDTFEMPELNIAGTIAQAIANMVMAYSQSQQMAAKMGPWAWVAFAATGLAELVAIISSIHGATGYATGGIIGGNSYCGDKIPVRVNSGEMILNRWQQKRLFDMANGNVFGGIPASSTTFQPRLNTGGLDLGGLRVEVSGRLVGRGRQLVAVIGNEGKARGAAGWRLPWK